jgi:hypothetical protein
MPCTAAPSDAMEKGETGLSNGRPQGSVIRELRLRGTVDREAPPTQEQEDPGLDCGLVLDG